jgi:hypothetical protein
LSRVKVSSEGVRSWSGGRRPPLHDRTPSDDTLTRDKKTRRNSGFFGRAHSPNIEPGRRSQNSVGFSCLGSKYHPRVFGHGAEAGGRSISTSLPPPNQTWLKSPENDNEERAWACSVHPSLYRPLSSLSFSGDFSHVWFGGGRLVVQKQGKLCKVLEDPFSVHSRRCSSNTLHNFPCFCTTSLPPPNQTWLKSSIIRGCSVMERRPEGGRYSEGWTEHAQALSSLSFI